MSLLWESTPRTLKEYANSRLVFVKENWRMMKRPYDIQHSFFAFFWRVLSLDTFFYKRDKSTRLLSPSLLRAGQRHLSPCSSTDPIESIFLLLCLGPLSLGSSWSVILHILQNLYYHFSHTVNSHSLMIYACPYRDLKYPRSSKGIALFMVSE